MEPHRGVSDSRSGEGLEALTTAGLETGGTILELGHLAVWALDLHQRRVVLRRPVLEQLLRVRIAVLRERAAHHRPEAAQRPEAVHYCRRLIAAANHAVGALGIAAGHAVLFPLRRLEEFLECLRVAVLEQVARPLPAEDVVGRRAPRRALVLAVAHKELEEQRRHVEFPVGLAVRQDGPEQTPHARASEEAVLVRSLLVAVARRENDALDAHVHDFVKEAADAVRIRAVEEGRVRRHAEAAPDRFLDALDRYVVSAFAADAEVVVLALAVEVDREREVLRRREL